LRTCSSVGDIDVFQICANQSIDEDILRELEQMEKESDLDDILSYRSAAEHELQV
jgi:hypothetical protein